jgi:hypothetical protein
MSERRALPPTRVRQPREAPEGFLLFVLVVCLMVTVASLFWAHNPAANLFDPITETEARTIR